jgi:AraC-like DNA-binding protein
MTQNYNRNIKYLTVGNEIKRWGLYITGAGHIKVGKGTNYPLVDDPSHHYFHWSKGRRLSEYQILYIIKGRGVFESEYTTLRKIQPGDAFILFPGVWHRFKSDKSTGWDEFWVEFNGDLIKHYRNNDFLNPKNPIIKVGILENIVENYFNIIDLIKDEKPGFQYLASGNLMTIMGQIFASIKYQPFEGKQIENQIKQAKLAIYENMNTTISQEDLAKNVGLGYSLYRKKFKEYTGISPAQYQIHLRIHKAKVLLTSTNQPLKEIALNVGFDSSNYFYRLFKQKTGLTPSDYRKKNKR